MKGRKGLGVKKKRSGEERGKEDGSEVLLSMLVSNRNINLMLLQYVRCTSYFSRAGITSLRLR